MLCRKYINKAYFTEFNHDKIKCGIYNKDERIEDISIHQSLGVNKFCFFRKILTEEHFRMMKMATKIVYPISRALIHQARPYTTDIGQIKIYQDSQYKVHRVKILDLYTLALSGTINPVAKVRFLDSFKEIPVNFGCLYDFPPTIRYYMDIETQIKRCRLKLYENLYEKDPDFIDDYFNRTVKSNKFTVEILDFEDDIYTVDLIDQQGDYLSDLIFHRFRHKKVNSLASSRSSSDIETLFRHFLTSVDFFKQKTYEISFTPSQPYIRNYLIRVKIITWHHPESFYIIPVDPSFAGHDPFRKQLDRIQKETISDEEGDDNWKTYVTNQRCFFRNDVDTKLGLWLRGVVTQTPDEYYDGDIFPNDANTILYEPGKFIYKIRSIDYGFECFRAPNAMREVRNVGRFSRLPPFALRCRLFGVDPLGHNVDERGKKEFSRPCNAEIDHWIREKISKPDNDRFSRFYALFRSNIAERYDLNEVPTDITLFHRIELPSCPDDLDIKMKNQQLQKSPFDCLNTFLIDKGLVSSYMMDKQKSSDVELDEYIINLLVKNEKM